MYSSRIKKHLKFLSQEGSQTSSLTCSFQCFSAFLLWLFHVVLTNEIDTPRPEMQGIYVEKSWEAGILASVGHDVGIVCAEHQTLGEESPEHGDSHDCRLGQE